MTAAWRVNYTKQQKHVLWQVSG